MEIIMLGTGYAMATECYNTCFVVRNGEEYFLVDAGGGNGIFKQLEKAEISCSGIHHMFITHAHTDHILGAIWIIRKIATLMLKEKYEGNLKIFGHDEVIEALTVFCRLTLPKKVLNCIGERILFCEVTDGMQVETDWMKLQFFDIASTKMKQFGFQAKFPDDKLLACLGDEPYNEICKTYVEKVDWMFCEAFCLYADREIFSPYEKHHSTALDAGRLAEKLQVKNLVIYHTEDKNLAIRKKRYSQEAASQFSGKIYVPDDLEHIQL